MCSCIKIFFLGGGNRPKGFHQIAPKRILFFSVTNTTDFDHVWNNRHECVCWSVHPRQISEFPCRGTQAQKTAHGSSYFGWVLVTSVQLKQHNFGWQESFRGLVDIPRTCLLYIRFGGDVRPNKVHSVVNTTSVSIISGSRKNTA